MAITNLGGLKAAIRDAIDHNRLPADLSGIIGLAESEINARARFNDQRKTAVLTSDTNGKCALPSDFLEVASAIRLSPSFNGILEPITSDEGLSTLLEPGEATSYAVEGGALQLYPLEAGVSVSMQYYSAIPSIASGSDTDTNWLLTKYPHVYLYATLYMADIFVFREERSPLWGQSFIDSINGIRDREYRARFPESQPLVAKIVTN